MCRPLKTRRRRESISGLLGQCAHISFQTEGPEIQVELSSFSYRTENLLPMIKPGSEMDTRRCRGKYYQDGHFVETLRKNSSIDSFAPDIVSKIP